MKRKRWKLDRESRGPKGVCPQGEVVERRRLWGTGDTRDQRTILYRVTVNISPLTTTTRAYLQSEAGETIFAIYGRS